MLKIGLTGGIGSGKTTIAGIFKELGYPVYISDSRASELMCSDNDIIRTLTNAFGCHVYTPDKQLNKKKLADIIFNDKESLQLVNSTVHPKVLEDFNQWAKQQETDILIFESAILFEAGLENNFDYIICVYADIDIRVKRIIARDHVTEEKIKERINNQLNDKLKCQLSDFIINTDEGANLKQQVIEIITKLKSKSKT